ncbi:MAG TPA: YqgE/AlgH family protein, partial [Stellaceae bacterium]|nr:YqgE/AlgH family protein [Stellaceae bacterium]
MKIAWKLPLRLAGFVGAAALAGALATAAEDAPPPPEPAPGELLIASASMRDPRFHRSVILMVRHDKNGAFGIAINRLLGDRRIADLLSEADKNGGKDDTVDG